MAIFFRGPQGQPACRRLRWPLLGSVYYGEEKKLLKLNTWLARKRQADGKKRQTN